MTAEQALTYFWMFVATTLGIVFIALALVLFEIRKTMKAISDIAQRISILTDIKGWFDFANRFRRKSK